MDMNEFYRRIKKWVLHITISPLFKKDKLYNLDTELENKNGTLRPDRDHCWLTWESKWISDNGEINWSREAYNFSTIAKAEEGKKYLEKHLAN